MGKDYLISAKLNESAKPMLQKVCNETDTLNFVRKVLLEVEKIDETTADLKAIKFLADIKPGKARVMEHPDNDKVIVIQVVN